MSHKVTKSLHMLNKFRIILQDIIIITLLLQKDCHFGIASQTKTFERKLNVFIEQVNGVDRV